MLHFHLHFGGGHIGAGGFDHVPVPAHKVNAVAFPLTEVAGVIEAVGGEVVTAFHLVQARGQGIAAYLDFTGFAFGDRVVIVIGDTDFVAIGDMIQRRTERVARCAHFIPIGVGPQRLRHAQRPNGDAFGQLEHIVLCQYAAHGHATVSGCGLGADCGGADLEVGQQKHHQPAHPEHGHGCAALFAPGNRGHRAQVVRAEHDRTVIVFNPLGQGHGAGRVDFDHLVSGKDAVFHGFQQ